MSIKKVYHELMWQWLKRQIDLFVLVSCLILTLTIWNFGIKNDHTSQEEILDKSAFVADEMDAYLNHLASHGRGLAGLYSASEKVGDAELSLYIRNVVDVENYPSILRFSYVERKKTEGKDHDKFVVTQVVDRWGNLYPASGQDLMLDPQRRELIELVMSSNETIYGWVDQVANIAEYQGSGILVMTPLIDDGEVVGLINLVISADKVKEQIATWVGEEIAWEWWVSEQAIVARVGEYDDRDLFAQARVDLGSGIVWGVDLYKHSAPSNYWNWVLFSGILFSFMFYAVVYGLNSASARAEHIAETMTADLIKYKLALDSTSSHIIITDIDGKIIYANKAAEKLTGYSFGEMKGNTPRLWGRQMNQDLYKKLWTTIKVEQKVFTGEIWNKRKNGSKYLTLATIAPIVDNKDNLIGFVGIEEDITERKAASEEMRRLNELMVGREIKMIELKKQLEKYAKP